MKTHELDATTTRRAAIGLLGGFAALAVGAAPVMHDQTSLNVDVEILDLGYAEGAVERVDVALENHTDDEFVPEWFTWDETRKTRHNWRAERADVPIGAGERSRYELVTPTTAGRMAVGERVQLTVFETGTQRWQSIHFTPAPAGGSP